MASLRLTSSLVHTPVNAPTLQLGPVGLSGPTGLSSRGRAQGWPNAPTYLRRFIRSQPDKPTQVRRSIWQPDTPVPAAPVHPVTLGMFHVACPSAPRCSDAYVSDYPTLTGYSGAPSIGSSGAADLCRTRPFLHFFEFFLRVFFCLAFLLHPWDLLMSA